ncbi:RNA polymerase sigma factor [Thermostaphylospora chromogena]|nr:RNA polymerase sigma factor [Thermostaphylospora chromogena]
MRIPPPTRRRSSAPASNSSTASTGHWSAASSCAARDPHLAEDLAQDVFVRATRAMLGWRGESPAAWLLAIARNVLADHARRHRVELPLPPADELGVPEMTADAVAVRDLLDRLPERHRRLLTLVYLDGFSLVEVAAMTGRSTSAVKTAVWRARAAFAGRYRGCPELAVYENRPHATPITWGMGILAHDTADGGADDTPTAGGTCADQAPAELERFRAWVATLHDHDQANLQRFGLDLARLRKAAADGRVYAYVDSGVRISRLREIIDDPLVKTVRVADVTFNLDGA